MPFSTREAYQAVVIQISGKFLGSIEGPAFKETIDGLKESGKTRVIVDLSKADFMDSSAIGALIGAHASITNAGGDMKLAGMKDRIKNIFLLTRLLGPVFKDFDSVEEAAQSF